MNVRILPINLGDYARDSDWFGVVVFSPKGMVRECGSRNHKCESRSQEMSSHKIPNATLYLAATQSKYLFGIGLIQLLLVGVADGKMVGDFYFFGNKLVGIIHCVENAVDA